MIKILKEIFLIFNRKEKNNKNECFFTTNYGDILNLTDYISQKL
jgi:hypothetical protein